MLRFPGDFWLGLGLVAFSLFCLFYLIPEEVGALGSNAALMPVLALGALVILALLLIARAWPRRAGSAEATTEETSEHDSGDRHPSGGHPSGSMKTLGAILAVMAAYAWLLEWTGFLLTSFVGLAGLLVIMGVHRPVRVGGISIVVIAVLYAGFEILLKAPLPTGRLIESILW